MPCVAHTGPVERRFARRSTAARSSSFQIPHRKLLRSLDEETERRRSPGDAREVEEEAGHRGRVALEDDLQTPCPQWLPQHRLESVCEADALLRQGSGERRVAAHYAAPNRDAPIAAPALELPRVERPGRPRTEGDALVAQEILGPLRRAAPLEVAWCPHDHEPKRLGEPYLDHIAF